jgi:hypothetical protein
MRIIEPIRSAVLAAAFAAAAAAQSTSGYVFVAPGGATGSARTQATIQAGAGFEVPVGKGFGAGAEVGALSDLRSWGDSTIGVFSPTAYYHFIRDKNKSRRLDPFVDGGYTLFFRSGHLNLVHFGGGVNIWALKHLGARIELRDQVANNDGTVHYWGFRLGVAFR